jgi:glycosyltransferase involved in cell wall biosynthesis
MVLLIGNYPLDRYPSMQLFNDLMLHGLTEAGVSVELVKPEPFFGNIFSSGAIGKWLGYIDKFVLFPLQLRKKLADRPGIVHVCDHSSAMYVRRCKAYAPVLVTCHDLFAVRAALGEQVDCAPTWAGRILQRRILRGLRRTDVLACVSSATAADAERIVRRKKERPQIKIVNLAPNFDYAPMPRDEARKTLGTVDKLDFNLPFALHVGSNTPRKNRAGLLRIFARCRLEWAGQLVIAGEPLNKQLRGIANNLGIADRIVEVANPNPDTLKALYNLAIAMLYPSRFEGFGWPIIEAQASGCPVICSNSAPLPEIAGSAGLCHDVDNEEAFVRDLLMLRHPAQRALWSEESIRNAQRFSRQKMIAEYIEIYRGVGAVG